MERLGDKVALVTGASRGIRRAIAVGLAKQGGNLVLAARDIDGLRQTEAAVIAHGVAAEVLPTDVTREPQIEALFASSSLHSYDSFVSRATRTSSQHRCCFRSVSRWQRLRQ